MCCDCGRINDKMALDIRSWTCPCGSAHDRDVNAIDWSSAMAKFAG
jgi:putative transposase